MTQVITRVPDALLGSVDELVREGAFKSRSDAVRAALEDLVSRSQRAQIGRKIVEGYRKLPQDDGLKAWADRAGRALIDAEPW